MRQLRSGAWGEHRGVQVSASGAHKYHIGISPQEESSIREGNARRVRLWAAGAIGLEVSPSPPPSPVDGGGGSLCHGGGGNWGLPERGRRERCIGAQSVGSKSRLNALMGANIWYPHTLFFKYTAARRAARLFFLD